MSTVGGSSHACEAERLAMEGIIQVGQESDIPRWI